MKSVLPHSVTELIEQLSRLPGIGPKSASRLAFVLLQRPDTFLAGLSNAIASVKRGLHPCPQCFLITDEAKLCGICQDESRDKSLLCVVETSLDVVALEQSRSFGGFYHVLGGVISPLEGIGPDQLNLQPLFKRIKTNQDIKEIIIATNPSLEGEATALYISDTLKNSPISVTRIARGLPIGGSLEYADEVTVTRALEGRQAVREGDGHGKY